jgi:hypothetical protein
VDPFVFIVDPVQLPSAEKWLYIGFRGFRTREDAYGIDVQVQGLKLQWLYEYPWFTLIGY